MEERANLVFGQHRNYLTKPLNNGAKITTQVVNWKITGKHASICSENVQRSKNDPSI